MRINEIKPQFILVMGGAGSGKNHYIKHDPVASSYTLIDVDAIKGEMGLDAAIGAIKPMLQGAFNDGENVAHPTTGSNLKGQQNKIALAREYDYKVTIVLVDTPIEQAIAQVRKRYREGGHDVELDAIVNSNKKARDNFEALKGLADEAIVVGRSSVTEDSEQQKIEVEIDGTEFIGYVNGDPVGSAVFTYDSDRKGWYSEATDVDPEYRRMGVATAIYNAAKEKLGRIIPSDDMTPDAEALWKDKDIWESTATLPITFKVAAPAGFTPSELNTIAKIIQSEGQVDAAGLMSRIKQAKMFCVAIDSNKIIGISAIKIPNPGYHQGCFTKAGLAEKMQKYPYEMGWKVVLPAYRGKNLGSQMSNKLFTKVNKQQVFATVRADNMASITPLTQMGFKPAGKPYYGATGNKIILFTPNGQMNEDPIPSVQDSEQAKQYQGMYRNRYRDAPDTGSHEFMGSGVEAIVVRSPNDPSIIKIVGTKTSLQHCGTLQYLLHCKKHAYSNPYLPRVHSIQEFNDTQNTQTKMDGRDQTPAYGSKNFYVIKMEELLSLYEVDDNPKIIAALCAKTFPGSDLTGIEAISLADLIYWVAHDPLVLATRKGIKVIDKQLLQAIKLIKMVQKQTGANLDLHSENVMVRVGPTGPHFVISDPLVNRSNF
jgi:ribosomal protein S18 acetylase RimI-like enzyme